MGTPRIGPRKVVYQDEYHQIYRVTADFGGYSKDYSVRESGRRAGMVVLKDGAVLLVRQYRLLINGLSWEIPGGGVNDGEQPKEAAARECLEETGVRCLDLKPLIEYQPSLDTVHNPTYVFYAEEFELSRVRHSATEEIDHTAWIPLTQCLAMVFDGRIVDALSLISILSYHTMVREGH